MILQVLAAALRQIPFKAFSGDLSCDFENENWDEGLCNWRHDFASRDVFQWKLAPASDSALKKKWRYG